MLGAGLVTFVAPLTATVMAAADPDHVSIASGVNNAIARAGRASLGSRWYRSVSGLSAATGAAEITDAYGLALVIAAATAGIAAPLMILGLPRHTRSQPTVRPRHCAVDGPPLQP